MGVQFQRVDVSSTQPFKGDATHNCIVGAEFQRRNVQLDFSFLTFLAEPLAKSAISGHASSDAKPSQAGLLDREQRLPDEAIDDGFLE